MGFELFLRNAEGFTVSLCRQIVQLARVGLPAGQCRANQQPRADGPPCLILGLLAPFFFSAQQRSFRRGRDPSRTQLRDADDELHRNLFSEWEVDSPLSQLIAPEFIFERREKRPRCGE